MLGRFIYLALEGNTYRIRANMYSFHCRLMGRTCPISDKLVNSAQVLITVEAVMTECTQIVREHTG